jgi:hypothetical protein
VKLCEHGYWPPKWNAVIKQDKSGLPWDADGFCKAAVLESVDDILIDRNTVVTINVRYGPPPRTLKGDLYVDSESTQQRLHEFLSKHKSKTIEEIGALPFD